MLKVLHHQLQASTEPEHQARARFVAQWRSPYRRKRVAAIEDEGAGLSR